MPAADQAGPIWVDPNAAIAEASKYVDFRRHDHDHDHDRFPVILELRSTGGVVELRDSGFVIPSAYPDTTCYCTALLDGETYGRLREGAYGKLVKRWELQLPVIPLRPQGKAPSAFGLTSGALLGHGTSGGTTKAVTGSVPGPSGPPHEGTPCPPMPPKRQEPVVAGEWLLGIIDTGCPFAHAMFARPDGLGTRLIKLWDQDADPALTPMIAGSTAAGFDFGWEVFGKTMEDWMEQHRDEGGRIDEDSCYLQARYGMAFADFGHGAAVMSLLAAPMRLDARYPQDPGECIRPPTWKPAGDRASKADIVFVQAPRDAVQDSSSAAMARSLLDGLRYIVASRGPGTKRIVVNISDGTSRGLHDGTSIIECAMAELVEEVANAPGDVGCTLQIVIAAGNSFEERRHAHVLPCEADPTDAALMGPEASGEDGGPGHAVLLRIPPDAENPQFLNVRVPPRIAGAWFRVTPPGVAREDAIVLRADGQVVGWPAHHPACWLVMQPQDGSAAAAVLISWAPTGRLSLKPRARGLHGDWWVEAFCSAVVPGDDALDVHYWVSLNQQNDGSIAPARQARFIDRDLRYDPQRYLQTRLEDPVPSAPPAPSVIQRQGTLSGLATLPTGRGIWVVGSRYMRVVEDSIRPWQSDYSSRGPAQGAGRDDLDGWRPTDFSRWSRGIRASGTRSGRTLLVTGTSFATAQWIRELLEIDDPQAEGPPTGAPCPMQAPVQVQAPR